AQHVGARTPRDGPASRAHQPDRTFSVRSTIIAGRRAAQHEDQPRTAGGMGGTAMSLALVTGGGGFLGLYIVEQLVARGDKVRVLCRGRYARLDELGVESI